MPTPVTAAGTLPWRRTERGGIEVALVHRPKYRDWSWAKGKLDPGERPAVAACRETLEETGLRVRLGVPLPGSRYPLLDAAGRAATKTVHYWAGTVTGGSGALEHEVDEVAWLAPEAAYTRLDYARDRDQLLALVKAERERLLETWPLVLVRHAKALPRAEYKGGNDQKRPLTAAGREQVPTVTALLGAYGVERVLSSPSVRCLDTVSPFAKVAGVPVKTREGLSEEGFHDSPDKAVRTVAKALAKGRPVAVCSHGPLVPTLVQVLVDRVAAQADHALASTAALRDAIESRMAKGEVMVMHCQGAGPSTRIVAVERHDT